MNKLVLCLFNHNNLKHIKTHKNMNSQSKPEFWKVVPFLPQYAASTEGRIKFLKYNRILKGTISLNGYYRIKIKTRMYQVHRLIALTWLPNPDQKKTVNHKNHNKLDNRVCNLDFATQREQNIHKTKPKTYNRGTTRKIQQINVKTNQVIQTFENTYYAAQYLVKNRFTCSQHSASRNMYRVLKDPTRTAYGYCWKQVKHRECPNEKWVDLPNHPNYQISNYGRIQTPQKQIRDYIQLKRRTGYPRIRIQNKVYQIHILVALYFVPNPKNKKYVNHKNGNKWDPRAENLEWVTQSENINHAFDTGLNPCAHQVSILDKQTNKKRSFRSIAHAAKFCNVGSRTLAKRLKRNLVVDTPKYKIKKDANNSVNS